MTQVDPTHGHHDGSDDDVVIDLRDPTEQGPGGGAREQLIQDLSLRSSSAGPSFGPAREILVWVLVVAGLATLGRHLWRVPNLHPFDIGIIVMSAWMAGHLILAARSRPWVTTLAQEEWLSDQRTTVVIAHYNEDPLLLAKCLESLSLQTRLPDAVWVIDDGSNSSEAHDAARQWAERQSFETYVERLEVNVGKRHAQRRPFGDDPADIIVTVDSDSVLDPDALAEGLKPFADPAIHAVSGSIVGLNWRRNLLTRVLDIEFVNSFVVGRAAMNRFRSMTVTCGVLALYRGRVVRQYLDAYVHQKFLGSVVRAGDDRDLTQFAMIEGRTVHQESAVAYTALPERVGHLVRQRFRWASSLYRGVVWSFVHLPPSHPGYWVLSLQAVVVVISAVVWAWLLLYEPIVNSSIHYADFGYLMLLSCGRSLRYLGAQRRNQTTRERWGNFLLAPLVAVLYMLVLTPVLYAGVVGVRERTWWTRRKVEVLLDETDLPSTVEPAPVDLAG